MPRIDESCEVIAHKSVGPNIYLLTLRSPNVAENARPGQFIMVEVKAPTAKDPLLRRPFSIAWTNSTLDTFEILYKVVGRGTGLLSLNARKGDHIKVLGPLGNGFSLGKRAHRIIVGGGLGIAPILFLYSYFKKRGEDITCLLGARTGSEIQGTLSALNIESHGLHIVTEDGSLGEKGLVTGPLKRIVKGLSHPYIVQACGPLPMLKAVSALEGIDKDKIEVSLESFMACGIGLCLGCAHETPRGFVHVCKDGPVFRGSEVF